MIDFTLITSVYNGEKYIFETIDNSIKYTSGINAEILVIDDGSTDTTHEILKSFGSKIRVITQENRGEAEGVNKGIFNAKGKYCIVVSADDPLISKELFEIALKIFNENKSIVVVYPDWHIIDDLGNVIETKKTLDYSFEVLLGEFNCLPGPGSIFKTEIAKMINGRNKTYKFVSDYDFWLRIAQYGDFVRIPKILAQWRNHSDSTSVRKKGKEMALERIAVIENYLMNNPQNKSLYKKALSTAYYNAAILAFFTPEVPGRKLLIKALSIRRGWIKTSKVKVVTYLLLLPMSRYLYKIIEFFRLDTKFRTK